MIEWLAKKGGWKNANHLIWFFTTLSLGIFATLLGSHTFGKYVFLIPIGMHCIPIIATLWFLVYKKQTSEIYSIDCIWYNAIMILYYVIVVPFMPR